ncbi:hypothetical protein LUD75_05925 [Epilithonimonas sp. JDS]|uniref:hypothetical protein n=1 Tax=Epilithonimonas sp. JDS TaxID=2902797 RepID=UPI001E58ECE0|nr:hypothetical protein [Epilithonimonas sp. JDS]MCD9854232.1 hypothetical protein [Epilithonimonas sp. JDS]
MKNSTIINRAKLFMFSFLAIISSALTFAQDSTVTKTTNVTTSSEEWQTNPTYWIIGGVVLIVIVAIVAMSGRKRND